MSPCKYNLRRREEKIDYKKLEKFNKSGKTSTAKIIENHNKSLPISC